ncbi:hypothetical protein KP509_05G075100 [Ceratopteris richardii]|uniref:Uncharacterized protein n=1 Tax=Ceratopteris richardii TaxID=49495 RepID=A0A8T2UVN6_CERRI|nr:hypothetical protein KP509_05G075100 [Ceratopteris richardii]
MGRQPCCEKLGLKKGPWSVDEDRKLVTFIMRYGHSCWREVPKLAGLLRCGKSCRLRWTNYLRPDLKRGLLSDAEENLVIDLHAAIGNRWSRIAAQLPGRTDNEIKNYWNTRIKKKLRKMGIDPDSHRPLSEVVQSQSNQHKRKSSKHFMINATSSSLSEATVTSEKSTSKTDLHTLESYSKQPQETTSLSKKERLEVESREAHMRVQKMKQALIAYNSRFANSPPTVMSSPTSVITSAQKAQHEDQDDMPVIQRKTVSDNFCRTSGFQGPRRVDSLPTFPFTHVSQGSSLFLNYTNISTFGDSSYNVNHRHSESQVNNHLYSGTKPLSSQFATQYNEWNTSGVDASPSLQRPETSEWQGNASARCIAGVLMDLPSEEAIDCMWINNTVGHNESGFLHDTSSAEFSSDDTKQLVEVSPSITQTDIHSQGSSIASYSLPHPPSNWLEFSSWNPTLQQFLEDFSVHSCFSDSQIYKARDDIIATDVSSTSCTDSLCPRELQQIALMLDDV